MPPPDPKQQANAPKSFDETLRALQEIGSFLEVDEETVQLPIKVLAAALPPGIVRTPVPPELADKPVLMTIRDLMFKLSKGKITVTVGDIMEVMPPQIVSGDASSIQAQEVRLPLPVVVAAVDPNVMREKMAAKTHRANLSNLPDPFSSLRGALDNFAKQGGTAQAPVPPPAAPATPVPPPAAPPKPAVAQMPSQPPIPPPAVPPRPVAPPSAGA
jgi:hypothetical protein